jgi:hypothetical protein
VVNLIVREYIIHVLLIGWKLSLNAISLLTDGTEAIKVNSTPYAADSNYLYPRQPQPFDIKPK